MRPPNQAARDRLRTVLGRRAAVNATTLAEQLGVSIPTLHRLLKELPDETVSLGQARRTRHALRRPLRGEVGDLPLYAVDATGQASQISHLTLVQPEGSALVLAGTVWPVPDDSLDGWWGGLPYPIYDMQPQGYLGRQMAGAVHQALRVSPNPNDWGDDDLVHVLSQVGSDTSGNLILGDPAFSRWQTSKLAPPQPADGDAPGPLGKYFAQLAQQAVAAGVQGSSVAGEFPKFPALRTLLGSHTPHVLVKFSGADNSPAVQRWSDLLVCEHLALQALASLPGLTSAKSRVVQHGGRTFLEVERFDRHGLFGRSPLVSLATLDAEFVGLGRSDWPTLARHLQSLRLLNDDDVRRVELMWWFGGLIANTDMHLGNLSFVPVLNGDVAALALAPAYDLLPMRYAPLPSGELATPPPFAPTLPLPQQRLAWNSACSAAIAFWQSASQDARISAAFGRECLVNANILSDIAARL